MTQIRFVIVKYTSITIISVTTINFITCNWYFFTRLAASLGQNFVKMFAFLRGSNLLVRSLFRENFPLFPSLIFTTKDYKMFHKYLGFWGFRTIFFLQVRIFLFV